MSRATEAPPMLLGFFLGLPPIRDEHTIQAGFYLGATMEDEDKFWRGYALYESNSDSTAFVRRGEFSQRAMGGKVSVPPLSTDSVDYHFIDYASEVIVELFHSKDALESVSESEMLSGRNRFVIGREIIGAANCELVSTDEFSGLRTYKLTTLLRGIKGTFTKMDSHRIGEQLVWLDGPGIYFFPFAASRIGEEVFFKVVPGGGAVAEAFPYQITLPGGSLAPFVPVGIQGRRNGSNDVIVTWERQIRTSVRVLDQGVPLDDDLERVKIRSLTSITSDVALREVVLNIDGAARTWTYTSSQQIQDGLTPGNTVHLELLSLSSVIIDGEATRISL